MSFMLLRHALPVLFAVMATLPSVASAEVCVAVHGPVGLADEVRRSLADRGIGAPTGTCSPATLTVSVNEGDAVRWTLALPAGEASERLLAHTDVGSMWVDSMVRGRLDALWGARIEPVASRTNGVRLFASFDAWMAGIPSAVLDVDLVSIAVDEHLVGPDGLERMWVLDR
ncbi:MAG TPA: hypothetical protein DFR83_19545, partial [Deltaproteobacteria bacterium]|nr:hypothetical protein [Deltaproteobacteria bacterium]